MPDQSPKRGAIPSPRSTLAAAVPYLALVGAPPNLIMKPQRISMWGNDVHGDCVTAEEAFAKACNNPEVFISDAEVIAWATRHVRSDPRLESNTNGVRQRHMNAACVAVAARSVPHTCSAIENTRRP